MNIDALHPLTGTHCYTAAMQSFLPLKAALLPICFDPSLDNEPAGFAVYRTFYQLDTVAGPEVSHRMGTINSGTTNNKEYRLAVQYWLPPKAQATVLIVHGYYDHLGLYR